MCYKWTDLPEFLMSQQKRWETLALKYITFKDSGPGKTCHTVLVCSADGKQLLPLLMFRRKMGQKVMIC